jgi:16S rRNA (guanine966-N2)-methyltransferase
MKLQIIGGKFKRTQISIPDNISNFRPAKSVVREAIFNVLQTKIAQSEVLELCAGSCVFSMEAISRGAKNALAVEQNLILCDCVQRQAQKFSWSKNLEIFCENAINFVENCDKKFDVIYFDPPYYENELSSLAKKLPFLCKNGGIIVFEFASDDKFVKENYASCDFRKYGKTSVLFMKKE